MKQTNAHTHTLAQIFWPSGNMAAFSLSNQVHKYNTQKNCYKGGALVQR